MCYSLLLLYKELWEGNCVNKDEISNLALFICLLNVNFSLEKCILLIHMHCGETIASLYV